MEKPVAAIRKGSLMFTDGMTADRSIRMNSEMYKAILAAHIQPNATDLMDGEWNIFQWPIQLLDLKPIELHSY